MSEIVDIVHRLTYEVNDSSIKKQINTFNDLNKKVDNYQSALSDSANKDAATQKALQAELKKTLTARERVGNSIVAQVASNKKLQDSIKGEINLLEQLQNKLKIVEAQRVKASPKAYATIDSAIGRLKNQISSLTSADGGSVTGSLFGKGGILGELFGSGSAGGFGRQIFQGALVGLGIGGGFGLVTRLTSSLIELGKTYLDTAQKEEEFNKATKELNDTLTTQLDAIAKQQEQYVTIDGQHGLDGLKMIAEIEKAKGIIRGNSYEEQKRNLVAEQNISKQNIKIIENEKQVYLDAQQAILNARRSNPQQVSKPFEGITNENTARAIEKIQKEAKSKGIDLEQTVSDKIQEINTKLLYAKNEQAAKELEFNSKLAEEEFQLNRSLLIAIRKEQSAYNVQRLKDYDETSERIRQIINIERNEAIKEVDDEIQLAKDKGIYTTQIEADYANKKAEINKKYNLQLIEQYKEFVTKYTKIGDELEKIAIKSQPNTLTALLNPNAPSLSQQQDIAEAKNKALLSEYSDFAENLAQRAIKNEVTQLEIDKELGDRKLLLQKQINKNLVDVYAEYYAQIEALDEKNAQREINALNLREDSQKEKRSFDLLRRRLSPYQYAYRNQVGSLQNSIASNQSLVNATQGELSAAYLRQSNTVNDPKSTKEQIDAANAEVTRLESRLAKLNTQINEEKVNLSKLSIQHIAYEIEAYTNLANAAISAYQQINAAHAQYLDAEISIQTERVREAEVLAQRGNTAILQREEETLRKQEQQKELYAKREMELNAALALSNAIVAVAKAAAEGGVFAPATIAAVLAALVAGYGFVKSTQTSFTEPGFAEGGFTGHGGKHEKAGAVHRGEFVVNAEKTKQFRPLLEAIHRNDFDAIRTVNNDRLRINDNSLSKSDISILAKKLDENTDAVRESKTSVNARVDQHGLAIFTQQAIKRDRRKWA